MGCCGKPYYLKPSINSLPEALTTSSASTFAKSQGTQVAETSLIDKRLQSCKQCPYFDGGKNLCTRCGCLLVAKIGKAKEVCPINRW